jgi:hypothetical protein
MTPDNMEEIVFWIGDMGFDWIAIMVAGTAIMGLIVGILMLYIAVTGRKQAKGNRFFAGILGTLLLSCVALIGTAFV